ncbi:putative RNA helicase armi [Halotydeus destructor]|nr:putative RNA helicase armi [Halotydeus destructor]
MLGFDSLLAYVSNRITEGYFESRREQRQDDGKETADTLDPEEAALEERLAKFHVESIEEPESDCNLNDVAGSSNQALDSNVEPSYPEPNDILGGPVQKRRPFGDLLHRDQKLRHVENNRHFIVPGPKEFSGNKHERRVRLPRFEVPNKIFDILHMKRDYGADYPVLKELLTPDNYLEKFRLLLHIEEARGRIEMRQYDMDDVVFERLGSYLAIDVPGLIDNRPSLLVGDTVIIEQPNVEGSPRYEGCIHHIRQEKILVRFADAFHDNYNGECYNVTFQSSRTYFKRCHYAVQQSVKFCSYYLFPQTEMAFLESKLKAGAEKQIRWINKSLNDRQKRAVINVMKGECRPSPYVIFGPPGTGKTVTVVETILQVFKNFPHSHVIACAPSNACVDLIALKLVNSGIISSKKDMVRLIAHHRLDRIPAELDAYAVESSGSSPEWINARIIVSTCGSVGQLMDLTKRAGFFTHCFLDEAAQATEPEALQFLHLIAIGKGVSVVVGDPFQLGPVCISPDAKKYGLGKSLLNRLFDMEPYKRRSGEFADHGHYDPRCITKLVESYRCCTDIISVNSSMFYMSELDCKPSPDSDLLSKLGRTFPVVFNGVNGQDVRHPDSASWCNYAEVLRCADYLRQLYDVGVKADEIGIITPYRKQMEMIRKFLDYLGFDLCKIATVEEFQGSERKVIIVSLVRTNPKNINYDIKKQLGFIFNEKRFNVATTRAKSLLIVIGDPFCLVNDVCWKTFIGYCMYHDAYEGIEFTQTDLHRQDSDVDADAASDEEKEDDKW